MARETVGVPFETGVRRIFPVQHDRNGLWPRVGLRLEISWRTWKRTAGSIASLAGSVLGCPVGSDSQN